VSKSPDDLVNQLHSTDPQDRLLAVVTIGRERMYTCIRYVEAALNDQNPEVRAMAMWALDLLGSPSTVPVLLRALYDRSFDVRSNAGWGLVHLAQRMIPALVVPELIDILRDEDNYQDARQMAYLVLSRIGGEDAESAIRQYWK
jgi:HEAT repeat protein